MCYQLIFKSYWPNGEDLKEQVRDTSTWRNVLHVDVSLTCSFKSSSGGLAVGCTFFFCCIFTSFTTFSRETYGLSLSIISDLSFIDNKWFCLVTISLLKETMLCLVTKEWFDFIYPNIYVFSSVYQMNICNWFQKYIYSTTLDVLKLDLITIFKKILYLIFLLPLKLYASL